MSTSLRSTSPTPDAARLRERIIAVFSNAMHVDVPATDTDLFETGVLDSLAFVELLLNLEREFGVETSVADLEIENFSTITRITDFVMARATPSAQPRVVDFGRAAVTSDA